MQIGASWLVSAKSWIQPLSRCEIESEWSFQMLIGAPMARLATVITIGRPRPEALWTASTMNSRPCDAVAVGRAPAADEPMATLIAANSDSTLMNSQFAARPTSPSRRCLRRCASAAKSGRRRSPPAAQRDGFGDGARTFHLLKHGRPPAMQFRPGANRLERLGRGGDVALRDLCREIWR